MNDLQSPEILASNSCCSLTSSYLIPVPDMEEAGNGLLPPGIILLGLQLLLHLGLFAQHLLGHQVNVVVGQLGHCGL